MKGILASGQGGTMGLFPIILMYVAIFGIMYFLLMRPPKYEKK